MKSGVENIDFTHPILLFDGVCNFCNDTANTIIKLDKAAKFRFVALQSAVGRHILEQYGLSEDLDSVILIKDGKAYQKSDATVQILKTLGGFWSLLSFYQFVPRPIRDGVYDWVARNRYKWFGKKEACMIPAPEVRSRFYFD